MQEHDSFNKPARATRKVRFAAFEVDLEQRELRKRGIRMRLQQKPFRILELLLERAGALVTREELAQRLWPGLHVNFDHGLNTAVNALRQALGDSSRDCRFIETRSGLGYVFVAPVEEIHLATEADNGTRQELAGQPVVEVDAQTANFDVHQDCLKGRYFLNKLTEDDIRKGIAYFEAALAQHPYCAPAYAGLAEAYCQLAVLGAVPEADRRNAQEFARSAVRYDSELAEAHVAMGRVNMLFDWDWKGAEAAHLRAIGLRPTHADSHRAYGTLLSAMARHESALKALRRARALDPLSMPVNIDLAWSLHRAGDSQAAVEHCWKVLTLEPKFGAAQYILGLAYEQLEMYDEAITELGNADNCSYDHAAVVSALGHVYASAGMRQEALKALRELDDLARRRYVSPYWESIIQVALGERVLAVKSLRKACDAHDAALLWLNADPRLSAIRNDAGFGAVVRDVGLKLYPASIASAAAAK